MTMPAPRQQNPDSLIGRIDLWLTQRRIRLYPPIIFAGMTILYLGALLRSDHWIEPDGRVIGRDYLAFFMAGEMVRDGAIGNLYSFPAQQSWQRDFMADINPNWSGTCLYLNPPHYAWFMSLVSRTGYGPSLIIFWLLSIACFVATVLIWRSWLPASQFKTAVILAVCMPAWFWALVGGQNSFFSLLILTGFCAMLCKRRDMAAGLVLSMMAFKFQLLLLPAAMLLLTRRWRACLGLAIGGVLTAGFTILAMGPQIIGDYVQFGAQLSGLLQIDGFDVYKQHSWNGFFALLGLGYMPVVSVRILAATFSLATLAIVASIWRKRFAPDKPQFALQLSALMMAALVTSPHLFHYDMLIAILPVMLWLKATTKQSAIVKTEMQSDANDGTLCALTAAGFCWLALSPAVAGATGIQLSPLLMTCWLIVVRLQVQHSTADRRVASNAVPVASLGAGAADRLSGATE